MISNTNPKYHMTLSLNVLKHLGLGLYSNVPAVLSEVVANAWDADAKNVEISIDRNAGRITIRDDGHGMTLDDANRRYLTVGYERRSRPGGGTTEELNRPVMGRKGIGKLSLFSIADTVEVHSVRDGERHGFLMTMDKIEEAIADGKEVVYNPTAIDPSNVEIDTGTLIILTNLKRRVDQAGKWLRRRLARRFSIIGEEYSFRIMLDGSPVTLLDRDYFDKIQYIWTFGQRGEEAAEACGNLEKNTQRPHVIQDDLAIGGWIGTASKAGQLRDQGTGESINRIVIMVRGKLAQEDILEEFGEAGIYSKYIIGEIHADFLDIDQEDDIATTSRQRIVEDDPRYLTLRSKLRDELKTIQNEWTNLRTKEGPKLAVRIPQIREWFEELAPDHKVAAESLLGRINRLPIDEPDERRQLFVSGILAFESLKFRHLLHRIDQISDENLGALGEIFSQLDDLEANAYYQISKDRLEVIRKLMTLVDSDAKERAFQTHLYKHLWLLDPSWERATHTERMESQVAKKLDQIYAKLSESERKSRLDIRYTTTGNKHVVIELKRASRVTNTGALVQQIMKYRAGVTQVLAQEGLQDDPLEFICVIGKALSDWSNPNGREVSKRTLDGTGARIVMYEELIRHAEKAYEDYIAQEKEAGRVYRLIDSISVDDFEAMSPS